MIKLQTLIKKGGTQKLINGINIEDKQKMQTYIKNKYGLEELSNFCDFIKGKKDLEIGYLEKDMNVFVTALIPTSKQLKKNINEFNSYIEEAKNATK